MGKKSDGNEVAGYWVEDITITCDICGREGEYVIATGDAYNHKKKMEDEFVYIECVDRAYCKACWEKHLMNTIEHIDKILGVLDKYSNIKEIEEIKEVVRLLAAQATMSKTHINTYDYVYDRVIDAIDTSRYRLEQARDAIKGVRDRK
jgi:hypothetical protein